MRVNSEEKYSIIFLKNIIGGIGWAVGATIAFALIATLFGMILGRLGGLPFIGNFFARLVEVTTQALEAKKILP